MPSKVSKSVHCHSGTPSNHHDDVGVVSAHILQAPSLVAFPARLSALGKLRAELKKGMGSTASSAEQGFAIRQLGGWPMGSAGFVPRTVAVRSATLQTGGDYDIS